MEHPSGEELNSKGSTGKKRQSSRLTQTDATLWEKKRGHGVHTQKKSDRKDKKGELFKSASLQEQVFVEKTLEQRETRKNHGGRCPEGGTGEDSNVILTQDQKKSGCKKGQRGSVLEGVRPTVARGGAWTKRSKVEPEIKGRFLGRIGGRKRWSHYPYWVKKRNRGSRVLP